MRFSEVTTNKKESVQVVFSSLLFLVLFLPVTVIGYYLINPKFRNILLLLASLVFYAWGEPSFILILLVSIMANYGFGLLADKFRGQKKYGRLVIAGMAVWNTGIFFVFKYLDFTISNINKLFGSSIPLQNIALPIGISFFTFQAMSYVIDVYRGNGEVQKNPLNVALYLMFFPQLIAGPIVRYETVATEIKSRRETIEDFSSGLKRFIVGLSKKVLISNMVGTLADTAFSTIGGNTVIMAWMGALAYAFQILFDFSGYSDMAIGLGRMFGFHFNENFDDPYCASSVTDFWRRWHISLGTWFRDYIYIPLGGSRVKSRGRLVFNLFVVWMLTGIWHGASWNFVAWGFLYFVLLTFEKLTGITKKLTHTWQQVLYRIFTLLCVLFGWVIFRAPGLKAALAYIGGMFGADGMGFISGSDPVTLSSYVTVFIAAVLLCFPWYRKLGTGKLGENGKLVLRCLGNAALLCLFVASFAFVTGSSYNPFIYFNF